MAGAGGLPGAAADDVLADVTGNGWPPSAAAVKLGLTDHETPAG